MTRRPLGKTGMMVSEIAFGGVEIGMPYGIGIDSPADMISESGAIELLHASFDAGINFYDTAREYGRSELLIGKAFAGRRSEIHISTKCRHFFHPGRQLPSYGELMRIMEKSLRESMEALGTDYIDVFMLHQGPLEVLQNESISKIMTELKRSGAIRATGVSTYTPEETACALRSGVYDVVQIPLNLLDQRQADLFPIAFENGAGLVVRSVLMKGLLSHRGKQLHPALTNVEKHIHGYDDALRDSSWDLPALATKFALTFPEVSTILVGLDRMEYLQRTVAAADGNYLDEKLFREMRSRAYPDPGFLNLHTWSQQGWLR